MRIKFSLDQDFLRETKLFIATPLYNGKCHVEYLKSFLSFMKLCAEIGIPTAFSTLRNESLIQRGRNYLADEFLRSGATHLIFVDADISFDPEELLALVVADKDVVGGYYPRKKINWRNIIHAQINLDVGDRVLYKFGCDYDGLLSSKEDFIEVGSVMTGFTVIKRNVFLKMKLSYPELSYKPDHIGHANFDGSREIVSFFSVEIDSDTRELLTEYDFFCSLWRKIGGKVHLCPWLDIRHHGLFHFGA